MLVFKFGGASIKDADSVRNVVNILETYQKEKLLIVVSAMGKTTNALETVINEYYKGQSEKAFEALNVIKKQHQAMLDDLFAEFPNHSIFTELNDLYVDVEWILEEKPQDSYDYLYDQIVSLGEFLSTKIVAAYLQLRNLPTNWLDVRDCISTDNNYRDANIEWEQTCSRIQARVPEMLEKGFVLTQGFIGVTSENFTTTLGREGSDFTAAIFAYCLNAESMTIWKDVPGVLTADPRLFKDATLLSLVSYQEAIEMTYYGAQVIHPKTLRPLQNKQIPLYVKSFVHPDSPGTVVSAKAPDNYPAVIVVKDHQALLKMTSKSFYFVDEERFSKLFACFAKHRVRVNMTQNTALAFSVCVDHDVAKLESLMDELSNEYELELRNGLKLITIRHTNEEMLDRFARQREIFLEERIRGTTQLVMNSQEQLS